MNKPTRQIKSSDFKLKPYMAKSNTIAIWQVLTVLVPLTGLWYMAYQLHQSHPWALLPIGWLMVMFLWRSFSLMHDCGHMSLFRSKIANRAIGMLLGVVNGLPHYPWSRGHAYHHKHNGDWEVYKGPAVVISVEDFTKLSPFRQRLYALLRSPIMLIPGGFFYLIGKSRIQLLGGLVAYVPFFLRCIIRGKFSKIFSYDSKFWYTNGEFWELLFNNICVLTAWYVCGEIMGHGFFWAFYVPVMTIAAASIIAIFYTQHNYEGSYAHRTKGWNYMTGALEGSSHLKLGPILNWFTADIGYHNIHHLCDKIPNYNLAACHKANEHLLTEVTVLHLHDIPKCYGYILWDAENDGLTTIAEVKQRQINAQAIPA